MPTVRVRIAVATAFLLALSACASAGKRFEQGTEHEARGEYARAAGRYIDALKKDPGLAEAHERLVDVAPRAIHEYLDRVPALMASGDSTGAADQYLGLDALAREASGVGVTFPLPAAYPADRRNALNGAIVQLLDQSHDAAAAGRWSTARRSAERVDRYDPARAQRAARDRALVDIAIGWGETDLAAGRYRSALGHVDEALALLGGADTEAARRAQVLRGEVLDRGTLPVATTPLWRTDEAARFMTVEFLGALNDALDLDRWTTPPELIVIADPAVVRQELRAQRLMRALLTPTEAARVGRSVGSETVVVGAVTDFTVTERRVTQRIQKTRIRLGPDTSFVYRSGTLDYRVRINYALIDVGTRREVDRGTVEAEESGPFELARFTGDWHRLDLTRNETRWFELGESREHEWAIEERLVQEASDHLAQRVYAGLLQRVDCGAPCR